MLEYLGAAAGLAALEGAARLYFRLRRGRPFRPGGAAEELAQREVAMFAQKHAVFHPYLGFVNHPERRDDLAANNLGFQNDLARHEADPEAWRYPRPRREGEVLVGVFGGSVALGFSVTDQRTGLLSRRLEALPAFRGRKVTVLNYAVSGHKQPQQLFGLAWALALGQEFDLVLCVDGFNEIVNSLLNHEAGFEPAYPAHIIWKSMANVLEEWRTPFFGSGSATAAHHAQQVNRWYAHAEYHSRLALEFLLARGLMRYHRVRRDLALEGRSRAAEDLSLFPIKASRPSPETRSIYQDMADTWERCALMMDALARGRFPLLHVLQPCQWLRSAGDFAPRDPAHGQGWVAEPVNLGYPELQRRIPALRAAGAEVLDATQVFGGNLAQEFFADDVCHFSTAGYDILYAAVAGELARVLAAHGGKEAP